MFRHWNALVISIYPMEASLTSTIQGFLQILFGGDQLTVARARSAQSLRDTHDSAKERLEGLR